MISQQRRDVKYFLKISYKKAQKNPLLLGTMRVLKSLSRPFVSLAVLRHHRSVCGLKGRAFPNFEKLLSHKTTTLSRTISRIGRKRTPGNSGAPCAGSSRICPFLPPFAQVFPGLPQLTLDNPAETWYNTGVGQGLTRARRNHTNCTKARNNTWHTRPGSEKSRLLTTCAGRR